MELKLWQKAEVDPKGKADYLEAGQGMENTLRMANEKQFYTLTDRGTCWPLKIRKIHLKGDGGRRPAAFQPVRGDPGQPGQTSPCQDQTTATPLPTGWYLRLGRKSSAISRIKKAIPVCPQRREISGHWPVAGVK